MRAIFVMIKCDMGQAYRVARDMADTIDAWQADEATSESFTLTFSGASLDADSHTTRTIRIRANTTCSLDESAGDCASC